MEALIAAVMLMACSGGYVLWSRRTGRRTRWWLVVALVGVAAVLGWLWFVYLRYPVANPV